MWHSANAPRPAQRRQTLPGQPGLENAQAPKRHLGDTFSTDDYDRDATWAMAASPSQKRQRQDEAAKKQNRALDEDEYSTLPSIAKSSGAKGTHSYEQTLYLLGITIDTTLSHAPEVDGPEPTGYVSDFDPYLLAKSLEEWFRNTKPNKATLLHKVCQFLFPERPTSDLKDFKLHMIFEFSGPFKSHNLQDLLRREENLKYPFIKRPVGRAGMPALLQTSAEYDISSRSDFVFACDWKELGDPVMERARAFQANFKLPGLSLASRSCAPAIVGEVKVSDSPASLCEARHQWASLAYLNLLERVTIIRPKPYADDANICQFGYLICGLTVEVWKMRIRKVTGLRRNSTLHPDHFTFPINCVRVFDINTQSGVRRFMALHKRILKWARLVYSKEYINDVQAIASEKQDMQDWFGTWREAVERFYTGSEHAVVDQYGPNQLHDMTLLEPYKEHDEPSSFNENPRNEKELSAHDAPGSEQQLPAQGQVNDRVDAMQYCGENTTKGTFCKNKRTINGFCYKHALQVV